MRESNQLSQHLILEWHPLKNESLDKITFTQGSGIKVWWLCDKGHEWVARIADRSAGNSCPFCTGKRVFVGFNDLATLCPDLVSLWDFDKNNNMEPIHFTAGSNKKVWWKCEKGHEDFKAIKRMSITRKCSFCEGNKILTGLNDLVTIFPELISEWHPTLNGSLDPSSIAARSHLTVWWLGICGHEWKSQISSRTAEHKPGCPYCSGNKTLAGFNDILTTHPDAAKSWHPELNGLILPSHLSAGSAKKVWWRCQKDHSWSATPANRIGLNTGCNVCYGLVVIPGINDLLSTNPVLAVEWHPTKNNSLQPSEVYAGGKTKVWWQCKKNHIWQAAIGERIRGSGCQECSYRQWISKPEKEISEYLIQQKVEVQLSNRKLLQGQEIDIYLPEYKVGIEFNGIYWHSDRYKKHKVRTRHHDKFVLAKKEGIELMQVWEDDWLFKTEVVKNYLNKIIGKDTENNSKGVMCIVSEEEAKSYLVRSSLQQFLPGSLYLGEIVNSKLVAVIALELRLPAANITTFSTEGHEAVTLYSLSDYLLENFQVTEIYFDWDNTLPINTFLQLPNLTEIGRQDPQYMYVIQNRRKEKSDIEANYKMEEYVKLPRIWDAGKTNFILKNNRLL